MHEDCEVPFLLASRQPLLNGESGCSRLCSQYPNIHWAPEQDSAIVPYDGVIHAEHVSAQ